MIRLDFAHSLPRWQKRLRWGLLAAGIAAVMLTLAWSDQLQRQSEALDWTQRASATPASVNGRTAGSATAVASAPQARELLSEIARDWRRVFAAIERSVTPEIRIMSIRPDPQRQLLLIQAKAPDGVQAQRFIERLQADAIITTAHLVHEQRADDDGLLEFSVRARWETEP
jgi:hypothetical protein